MLLPHLHYRLCKPHHGCYEPTFNGLMERDKSYQFREKFLKLREFIQTTPTYRFEVHLASAIHMYTFVIELLTL